MTTAATAYTSTEATSADRAAILKLWRRNLPGADAARFDWLYERGPGSGWLLRDGEGKPIGSTGLMERRFRFAGEDVCCGQAIDLNVDVEHRSIGPAMKLQRTVAAELGNRGYRFLYGFPNPRSEAVLKRIGYRPLGCFERWVKPLRSLQYLQRRFAGASWPRVVAGAVDFGLRLASVEFWKRRSHDEQFHLVDRFDHRFDELWLRTRNRIPYVGLRTAEYLNWRFTASPAAGYSTLAMNDRTGRLTAYATFCLTDGAAQIGDLFCYDTADLLPLLSELGRHLHERRATEIVCYFLGSDVVGRRLQQLGYWRRPSSWQTLFYDGAAVERTAACNDPQNWWLTRADVDTDV